MTRNQIEYLKLRETQRSNQATEQITRERDATTRELGFGNLGETIRHNKATEGYNQAMLGYNYAVLDESRRHNQATEEHNRLVLGETVRHNQASEGIELGKLQETSRHNQMTEAVQRVQLNQTAISQSEQARHNLAVESETRRSNLSRERETRRANLATERENVRRNTTSEQQRAAELEYDYARLAQTERYNEMSIGLGYSQVGLGYGQLAETSRANQAREAENTRSNKANETVAMKRQLEEARSNRASERVASRNANTNLQVANQNATYQRRSVGETIRSNLAQEALSSERNQQAWVSTVTGGLRDVSQTVRNWSSSVGDAIKVIGLFGG